ncbi:ATP-dependent DNA ligase [Candidatus Pacearchaeota archaeon]|nr:ATP-dependent DNA ligase [Candidatus Pacearchaeota archaeon]
MKYSELCGIYSRLESTTKKLEKTEIIAKFLKGIKRERNRRDIIYLLQGNVFPESEAGVLGVSEQLTVKALALAGGLSKEEVVKKWKAGGDLGEVAEDIIAHRKKIAGGRELTVENIITNFRKLPGFEGKGTVEKKLSLITGLLSEATPEEAKYIVRTLLSDMRVGVKGGILRDAIFDSCFTNDEKTKEDKALLQRAYDLTIDFGLVFDYACEGVSKLKEVSLMPGKPIKVMLFPKADSIEDAFRIVGKPAAFEYKYDGFRVIISKNKENITIYTRRLEEVSRQFPDLVKYAKKYIKAETAIVDGEAIGYDPETKKYMPFQDISQRIKRIYNIEKIEKELPVELVLFDLIYIDGESLLEKPFIERRKRLERTVKTEKYRVSLAKQIITSDEKEVEKFYGEALETGEEGVMAKNLDSPYKPGARIGYAVKLKPEADEFDLVITKAEYGTGKRGGWLTSYSVSCLAGKGREGELLEVGKVSTGLKEKSELGLSFEEMTKLLKPLIEKEEGREVIVKPKIVAMVQYQNIQKSPTYSSGYALRFPRIKVIRPDKKVEDANTLKDIEREYEKHRR